MARRTSSPNRRNVLARGAALGAALFTTRGLFAEQLAATPRTTEGPFYPDQLPLDRDNDLIIVNDSATPALGQVSHLSGRILSTTGQPIRNALIEIWQCDANAVYLHTTDSGPKKDQQDSNFQGYGKFETNAKGEYRFRTIKPVPYPGRPSPHIHFKVTRGGRELITSQIFIAGHAGQQKDGVFRRIRSEADRRKLETEFKPIPDSSIGELAATFNIVVGQTPDDQDRPAADGK